MMELSIKLLFMVVFMQSIKNTIPHKEVTIRLHDKPWYDSEIRILSRNCDRQRK